MDGDLIFPGDADRAAANQKLLGAGFTKPDAAATAIKAAPQAQIDPTIGMAMPQAVVDSANQAKQSEALQNPAVAGWVANAPDSHVAAAQDDLHNLNKISLKTVLFGADDFHSAFAPFQDIAESWDKQLKGLDQLNAKIGTDFTSGKVLTGIKDWASGIMGGIGLVPSSAAAAFTAPAGRAFASVSPADPLKNVPDFLKPLVKFGLSNAQAGPLAGITDLHPADLSTTQSRSDFFQNVLTNILLSGVPEAEKGRVAGEIPRPGTASPSAPGGPPRPVPGIGGSPVADTIRGVVAERDAAHVTELQSTIAESATHSRAPAVMQDFLESQVPNQLAHVDAGQALTLFNEHRVPEEEVNALFDSQDDKDSFLAAAQDGGSHPVPLSNYLAATAGKPWAKQLNQVTTFRNGGVSVDEAKGLGEQAAGSESKITTPFEISKYNLDAEEKAVVQRAIPAIEKYVEEQTGELYLKDMFQGNKDLALTQKQYEDYSERIRDAHQVIYDKAVAKLKAAIKRERSPVWKETLAKHTEALTEEMTNSPAMQASLALREKSGTPEEIADRFGYLDRAHMEQDVGDLGLGKKSVEKFVAERVKPLATLRAQDELGWDMRPDNILRQAEEGVTEPSPKEVVLHELNVLRDQLGGAPLAKSDIEAYVENRFGRMRADAAANVKTLAKNVYRAGEKTQKALQKGDLPTAFLHKQQQYVHVLLLDQAYEFRKEYARGLASARRWGKGNFPANTDPTFQAVVQVEVAAAGMPLRRDPSELVRFMEQSGLRSMADAAQVMELSGVPISVPTLSAELPKAPVAEFRDWVDQVGAVAKFGKDKGQIDYAGEVKALDELSNEILSNALELGQKFTPEQLINERRTAFRTLGGQVKTMLVNNIRPEVYLNWLDHGKIGPLMKSVVKPLMDGKYQETDLTESWVGAMNQVNKEQNIFQTMNETLLAPDMMSISTFAGPAKMINNRGNLRVALLHLGSETARRKMLEGFGWKDEQEQWLLTNATDADWAFARAFWDQNERLFDLADKMWMRTRGYGLKKDLVREIQLPDGRTIKGGYVHLQYNRAAKTLMKVGEPEAILPDDAGGAKLDSFPAAKLPSSGYTIERTNYVGPVQLDHRMLASGVSETIHDIAFREALIQSQKVLKDPRVQAAMMTVLGPEYETQMMPWLSYIAQERMLLDPATEGAAQLVRQLSQNLVFAKVALNLNSAVKHSGLGWVHVAGEVKGDAKSFAMAANDLMGSGGKAEYWRNFVLTNSGEVRGGKWNADASIADALGSNTLSGSNIEALKKNGYVLFTLSKQIEAYVTWLTRYRQEMADHGQHIDAVEIANKAVRDTQGAGSVVDTPPALRRGHGLAGELGRMAAGLLMGFRGTVANRLWTAKRLTGQGINNIRAGNGDLGREQIGDATRISASFVLGTALWLAIYTTFILGTQEKGAKSKAESAKNEFLWGLLDETAGGFVGVGQFESAIKYHETGSSGSLFDSFGVNVQKVLEDKKHKNWIKNGWNLAADFLGMPESLGKAVQGTVDTFDRSVPKKEKTPEATAQRILLGRSARRRG
jgi:hypothetical protein